MPHRGGPLWPPLHASLRLKSCSPAQTSSLPISCRLGELPAGATARISLIARAELVSQLPVHIINTALASAFIDGKYNQVLVETTNVVLPTPVILSASVSGKQLTVEGRNFVQGAVIEINGKPQATKV